MIATTPAIFPGRLLAIPALLGIFVDYPGEAI
jgi:hypothetical protein